METSIYNKYELPSFDLLVVRDDAVFHIDFMGRDAERWAVTRSSRLSWGQICI